MPLYTYGCSECHTTITRLRKYKNRNRKTTCHRCGHQMTRREVEQFSLRARVPTPSAKTATLHDNRPGLKSVTIRGAGIGLMLNNGNFSLEDVRLSDNKKGIVARNSHIDAKDVVIE